MGKTISEASVLGLKVLRAKFQKDFGISWVALTIPDNGNYIE